MNEKFVICVNNESNPVHLTLYKVYRVVPNKKGDKLGLIVVLDDSDEAYAYPIPMFRAIELPADVQEMYASFPPESAPIADSGVSKERAA